MILLKLQSVTLVKIMVARCDSDKLTVILYKHEIVLPGTIPSSTAALVAFKASVTLSFRSPTSASLAPPTCRYLNPPMNNTT